jgi:CHAT domain-containing protein
LLYPLEDWTEGKDVWIDSHGALFNLPWSALQDQKGHFVVERWHSHRLWWGMSNLVRLPDNLKNALLVAAPGKKQLEGVLSEVEGIGRTLRSSNRLIGPQATRAQLKRRLPSCQWLHLAAHSRLNRTSLNDSFVELSDGPLPLSQLYSLKLAPQTSVVLSSCQTALGQAQPGKDLISLGSGFRLSGAGQVLATLWPVDDQASVHFFQDFYVRLQKHTLVAPALYASSRKLLQSPQWQHPFYWAAYQLEGEMYR